MNWLEHVPVGVLSLWAGGLEEAVFVLSGGSLSEGLKPFHRQAQGGLRLCHQGVWFVPNQVMTRLLFP